MSPQLRKSPVGVVTIGLDRAQQSWIQMSIGELNIPYTFTTFNTAIEAIDKLAQAKFDIDAVFLNLRLPMLTVEEAVTALRALPGLSNVRFAVFVLDTLELELWTIPQGCRAMVLQGDADEVREFIVGISLHQ